jgi:hypothetical protein
MIYDLGISIINRVYSLFSYHKLIHEEKLCYRRRVNFSTSVFFNYKRMLQLTYSNFITWLTMQNKNRTVHIIIRVKMVAC